MLRPQEVTKELRKDIIQTQSGGIIPLEEQQKLDAVVQKALQESLRAEVQEVVSREGGEVYVIRVANTITQRQWNVERGYAEFEQLEKKLTRHKDSAGEPISIELPLTAFSVGALFSSPEAIEQEKIASVNNLLANIVAKKVIGWLEARKFLNVPLESDIFEEDPARGDAPPTARNQLTNEQTHLVHDLFYKFTGGEESFRKAQLVEAFGGWDAKAFHFQDMDRNRDDLVDFEEWKAFFEKKSARLSWTDITHMLKDVEKCVDMAMVRREAILKRAAEKSDPNFMGRVEVQIRCARGGCGTYKKVRVTKAERQRIGPERKECMTFFCARCSGTEVDRHAEWAEEARAD